MDPHVFPALPPSVRALRERLKLATQLKRLSEEYELNTDHYYIGRVATAFLLAIWTAVLFLLRLTYGMPLWVHVLVVVLNVATGIVGWQDGRSHMRRVREDMRANDPYIIRALRLLITIAFGLVALPGVTHCLTLDSRRRAKQCEDDVSDLYNRTVMDTPQFLFLFRGNNPPSGDVYLGTDEAILRDPRIVFYAELQNTIISWMYAYEHLNEAPDPDTEPEATILVAQRFRVVDSDSTPSVTASRTDYMDFDAVWKNHDRLVAVAAQLDVVVDEGEIGLWKGRDDKQIATRLAFLQAELADIKTFIKHLYTLRDAAHPYVPARSSRT